MTSTATFDIVQEEEPGIVRVRLDRPGVAAISYVGDAEELIRRIADAAGLTVTIEKPA
jgi:hypothetical protein